MPKQSDVSTGNTLTNPPYVSDTSEMSSINSPPLAAVRPTTDIMAITYSTCITVFRPRKSDTHGAAKRPAMLAAEAAMTPARAALSVSPLSMPSDFMSGLTSTYAGTASAMDTLTR